MIRKIKNKLRTHFGKPMNEYKGLNLPLFRNNHDLSDNQKYLDSAVEQIKHVNEHFKLDENAVFFDFGCGQGRLVNGFEYAKINLGNYYGVDTNPDSISWCQKWLGGYNDKYKFIHVPAYNARYNNKAKGRGKLPLGEGQADVVFLNSVFSHMLTDDVEFYLEEFYRILKNKGIVYMTAFVEENVPDMEENPPNYVRKSVGALHHVRYEKNFFFQLVKKRGFNIDNFYYQQFTRSQQSIIVARKIEGK